MENLKYVAAVLLHLFLVTHAQQNQTQDAYIGSIQSLSPPLAPHRADVYDDLTDEDASDGTSDDNHFQSSHVSPSPVSDLVSDNSDEEAEQVIGDNTANTVKLKTDFIDTQGAMSDEREKSQSSITSFGPVASPFFFMCHYPRPGEPTGVGRDEVAVKVQLKGKEDHTQGYVPHAIYQVLITSNVVIDGFMLTGVHALTKQVAETNYINLPASLHGGTSEGLVCAVLHSHISHKPRRSLSFLWMAPPAGTGCVAFLAQGSLGEELLFKDLPVLEVCERESSVGELRQASSLSGRDLHGLIFRDDFESHKLQMSIWSDLVGGMVGRGIGRVLHGSAATFTEPVSSITTQPFDLSRAKHLQFAIGSGSCPQGATVQLVYGSAGGSKVQPRSARYRTHGPVVSFVDDYEGSGDVMEQPAEGSGDDVEVINLDKTGLEKGNLEEKDSFITNLNNVQADQSGGASDCTSWEIVHTYRVDSTTEVHVETVPQRFRRDGVCVRWQSVVDTSHNNISCWGIDNVAITTMQASTEPLQDDFDPVDPSNWMFFPGDKIQESCGSEGNSLVFEGGRVTTRLMDLSVVPSSRDVILEQHFFDSLPSGWQVDGGSIGICASQKRLVFSGDGERRACTPFIDAKNVGTINLIMMLGECSTDQTGDEVRVTIYAERGTSIVTLRQYALSHTRTIYTIPVEDTHNLLENTRFCVEQTVFGKKDTDVWVLDHLRLLTWLPSEPIHFLQSRVNLECGQGVSEVELESSADGGLTWAPLHRRCLPAWCDRQHSAYSSSLRPQELDRWGLVTLPLPYISLTPHTRFRFRSIEGPNNTPTSSWAIDNVYIGVCHLGCSGRGLCQPDSTCKCEYGYSGRACEEPDHDNPLYVSEPFINPMSESANILKVTGGRSSLRCGVVGSGPAAVFMGGGPRSITTVDVNTTNAHFLQFHYVAGTLSDVGKCPGPNHASESVYVHYSCDGGVTWHLLHTLPAMHHKEPSHVSLDLPPGSRGPGCRFQIWQDTHSGYGTDVWAVDDLTVTSRIFNSIELDFSDSDAVNNSLRFHLGDLGGGVCGHDSAMVFDEVINTGSSRFIETKSIGIGPSYMMQFDLVIGCDETLAPDATNKVVLEYSLNHGISWQLVQRPCSPSTPGCESHFTRGTVYEHTEFKDWKRVTLRLPKHTWSPTSRLRLRQTEDTDVGESWAVDKLYIGRQCPGLCSGHGYCTIEGCSCDPEFHGHKCLPIHKLHRQVIATFDDGNDLLTYDFHVIGGHLAAGEEGCGHVVSKNSLYFGAPGIRQFETDDLNAEDLEVIQFMLVIGNGGSSSCLPSDEEEKLSAGSVVLEYSTDGGISWELLHELLPSQYRHPRLFRAKLEDEVVKADSGVVRFRIWQPTHDSQNQWAIDNLRITADLQMGTMQADFAEGSNIISPWMSVTSNRFINYCDSEDLAQVLDGEEPVRVAITNPLTLNDGDIISFQISVGCKGEGNNEENPVMLQYSKDGGLKWSLVDEGCSSTALHCSGPREPSIYRPDHHGPWTRVMLPVDHRLAQGAIQLRWIQENPSETPAGEFGLRDLYIGPPCPRDCFGHGLCTAAGLCKCDKGYNGKYCGKSHVRTPRWMHDDFDEAGSLSPMWERTEGASVGVGCGPHHTGNALLFSSSGPRFATTKELDTRSIKYLVFNLQIGSAESGSRCQRGQVPRDNVLLQHSPNNGQSWHTLQLFEPSHTTNRQAAFFIPLPDEARTKQTSFRWWQGYNGMMMADDPTMQDERAEWHLDNVMVLANESLPQALYDAFDGNSSTSLPWFMTSASTVTQGCGKEDNVMLFPGYAAPKYAETWDFAASESTLIQFDIKVGCEDSGLGGEVALQYSNDHGKNWKPVWDLCAPPQVECDTFHLPTTYSTAVHPEWTRITTLLPKEAIAENTRLRLISRATGGNNVKTSPWAIDNFYVGNSCPWMCSGHGYCDNGKCRCDEGYFGDFCVPASVLPCELLDTFNEPVLNPDHWQDSYGAEVSQRCGVLVSKSAFVFYKDGLRLATTIDMDMTSGQFVQFTLQMGCKRSAGIRGKRSASTFVENAVPVPSEEEVPSRPFGILVQYSSDGGITWHLLKEIHYLSHPDPVFVSINLDDFPLTRTNATRFRVWQPRHEGPMGQPWAIDNVFIGGMPVSPNVLYEDFNKGSPMTDAWIDWPAGEVGYLCNERDSYTGLVFGNEEGEHALYTRDLAVDERSVVQFDIKVGCGDVTTAEHNVSLQYSTDYGASWKTIHPLSGLLHSSPDCLHELRTPSIFYPNSARKWTRVIIPLQDLEVCGNVRFRWWQGYYRGKDSSAKWGLDNVYIGPACLHHCTGHGYCINGDQCVCDDDFEGQEDCTLSSQIPPTLLEDFESGPLDDHFERWSGAEVARFCGVLTGDALVFSQQGERMLMTKDLDLSHGSVVQFYIRFGCVLDDLSNEDGPVLLQFSTDGGISWTLLAELERESGQPGGLPYTKHITLSLPDTSKSNATRLRWWQPSRDGTFKSQWAIDQIHIGSSALGLPAFTDIDTGAGWLLRPGSVMEPVCGASHNSVHFTSREGYRFAETPDILVNEKSFIQFTAALGCKENSACFEVELEYSTDQGSSWRPIKVKCLPSDPDCTEYWPSSIMTSDLYTGPTNVTMKLPYKKSWTDLMRIRFIQRDGYRQQHTWALSHVYVGDECPSLCSGRGFCDAGVCNCYKGWKGDSCEEPEEPLPTFIVAEFTGETDPAHWRKIVGAQVSGHCGPIASGQALHFIGGCSRYLETVDLDLREALFIQFDLRTGCLDPVSGREAGGDRSIVIQTSCDAGISWATVKKMLLIYHQPTYVWTELPAAARCLGGRVRWWQPDGGERNRYDWALDSVIVGGNVTPPDSITYAKPHQLEPPLWLRRYNAKIGRYCENQYDMYTMMSTAAEPALIQTTDVQIGRNHSINFLLAFGCGATWDSTAEPVRLEYSVDFGNRWQLVREMCLPGNSSCSEIADASIYYAPLNWNRYVYPLDHIGPAKYVRFRWIQEPSADVSGSHQWSLRDVYIGVSCPHHCLGRGSCLDGVCQCESGYAGAYCQHVLKDNVPYIRDEFLGNVFQRHFAQVQGGLLSEGCGGLEEPPTATFQGPYTRLLRTIPVDTRSGRFVHFTAQIGSRYGTNICRSASHRHHNVFLQYSIDGGIRWHLLRELDHKLYIEPSKEYILIPDHARSPATLFRFWQPRLDSVPPAWSIDDLYIGGSEISAAQLMDKFENEPIISEWLFAPHSENQKEYCSIDTNGSLVWGPDSPGHRAITTQELIINEGHILQFKLSIGCGEAQESCGDESSVVRLEYSLDGGVTGWDLVRDSCLPGTSPDPDCIPYAFHPQSLFRTDIYSHWTRITIPLPEKTWSSTTQLRWAQEVTGRGSKVTPWSLDDVYVGDPCPELCHGHGDCVDARCVCDSGFIGESCEPVPSRSTPLPTTLVDGFEAGVDANWLRVSGGFVGLGCNSLAPYAHGKHLYFSGCGTRQAITRDMDTRRASKIMFVLRIGSHDHTPSCRVDLSNPQRALDKGVILQYTVDNGVTWNTINVHDPLDFRKARRVAYSLPYEARQYGVQLRWWQPDHDGANTDQWAIDNVEIVLAQRKDTSKYETKTFHDSEL